jgi:hypothetical protein
METKPQSRQLEEKFVVRLPDGMRERIADEAKARHRSMNSEIIHRLGSTFESDGEIARLYAIIDALIAGKPELAVGLVAIAQGA